MNTKGNITAEACICSVLFIFSLLLCIQLTGYAKAVASVTCELNERLIKTAVLYHATGVYMPDVAGKPDTENIDNVFFYAIPYDYCFVIGIKGEYKGVLATVPVDVCCSAAKWDGDGIRAPKCNIWSIDPLQRGQTIHGAMGANLDINFPVLDIYDEYTKEAVSIISINTTDKSYQSGSDLKRKLKNSIDAISSFEYGQADGISITDKDISSKTVMAVIPGNALNDKQLSQIDEMSRYAKESGVNLVIKKYQHTDSD